MKHFFTLLLIAIVSSSVAQQTDYNTKKGFIAEGYDVTEYFNQKAVKGSDDYVTTHHQAQYKFASKANLEKFSKNPDKYVPQYGGYCAYAVAANAEKVDIDPKTFEIRDGKLYLFYNAWGINTLTKWNEEGPAKLKEQADTNWERIYKK